VGSRDERHQGTAGAADESARRRGRTLVPGNSLLPSQARNTRLALLKYVKPKKCTWKNSENFMHLVNSLRKNGFEIIYFLFEKDCSFMDDLNV